MFALLRDEETVRKYTEKYFGKQRINKIPNKDTNVPKVNKIEGIILNEMKIACEFFFSTNII